MRIFLILASFLLAQSAMALAPQGENFKDGLIANTAYQGLVEGIRDSGLQVVIQPMDRNDLSDELDKKCTGGIRSGVVFGVLAVNKDGDVETTNYFGTTERAKDLKQCK